MYHNVDIVYSNKEEYDEDYASLHHVPVVPVAGDIIVLGRQEYLVLERRISFTRFFKDQEFEITIRRTT